MNKASPLPRITQRLVIRKPEPSDLKAFQAYRTDPTVAKYQGWEIISDEEASAFLEATNKAAILQAGEWCQLAIAEKETNLMIGDIGICVSKSQDEAELGFSLHQDWQGKGFAFEATQDAIKLIFTQTAVKQIKGITDARNFASIKLLERLGMTKVDALETVLKGEPCTDFVYVLPRPLS